MMRFASCVPNIGPYQEFKENKDNYPTHAPDSSLTPKNGRIQIPKSLGLGIEVDPDIVRNAKVLKAI